jgi:ketosteroid isomerase-like protein
VDEIFECNGGERVVALGYYYFRFHGQGQERKAQVAHVWTIRDGRAVKFQQYLDTLQSRVMRELSKAPCTFRRRA